MEAEAVAEQNRVGGPPTTHEAKPAAAVSLGEAEAPCLQATRLSSARLEREEGMVAFAVNWVYHLDGWPPLGLSTLGLPSTVDSHSLVRGDKHLQRAGATMVRDRLIGCQPDHCRQALRYLRGVE